MTPTVTCRYVRLIRGYLCFLFLLKRGSRRVRGSDSAWMEETIEEASGGGGEGARLCMLQQ